MQNFKSQIILGSPGSGKSESIRSAISRAAQERECSIWVMDSHGSTCDAISDDLTSLGLFQNVDYDRLVDYDRVLPIGSPVRSQHPNPYRRASENHATIMAFGNLIWRAAQRPEEDGDLFSRASGISFTHAGQIFLHQPKPVSLDDFMALFRPKSDRCLALIEGCQIENQREVADAVEEWRDIRSIALRNSDALLDSKIGFVKRVLERVLGLPALRVRTLEQGNTRRLLQEKRIVILNAAGCPREVATAVFGAWNLSIFQALQQNFAETGKPLWTVLVWEECAATRIYGPLEVSMLWEGRKLGLKTLSITQTTSQFDPRFLSAIKSGHQVLKAFNPGDTILAKELAEDMAAPAFDPHEIHSVEETERMMLTGFEVGIRKGKSKGEHGTTESESEVLVPQYKPVKDKRTKYKDYDAKVKELVPKLLGMGPGEFMMRDRSTGYVSTVPLYEPLMPDPYPEHLFPGLKKVKRERAIAESQAKDDFITPPVPSNTWHETTTPSAENVTRKPSRSLPKPRGRRGNSSN
jgi:hypothetical protein